MKVYKALGMVDAQKWRICTGHVKANPAPTVLKPHIEYSFKLKLDCLCNPKSCVKHRRDCPGCCQKCPICERMRKYIISFEYLSMIGILIFMCLSRTMCHEFWEFWRHKEAWEGRSVDFIPNKFKEFWDGSKVREYAPFWDPRLDWEVPIVCPNPTCKHSFQAFPESQRYEELSDKSWNNILDLYSFPCSECFNLVEAPRCKLKVRL